ncbi:hypothetical protein [Vibrio ouci]|uniref:Helicase/UvrB N-terminal domain-containing protein n=1 Tax=Vibrio ouci TaxID=2499078 RepID=A0A4Y8WA74_9VIBR|nr:hypothetical protein [Vibrio ouci]TFH89704.1 hypothetical protein ELS82_20715 [Vibrio ouci]
MDFKTYDELEKHQLTLAEKIMYFLIGRCGSGKTQTVLRSLAKTSVEQPRFTVWAAKGIELADQTFRDFQKYKGENGICLHSKNCKSFDGTDGKLVDEVRTVLQKAKHGLFDGVLFTTHSTLINIATTYNMEDYLKHADIFIDEIPKQAVEAVSVIQYDETVDNILQFCEVSKDKLGTSDSYQYVKLKENLSEELSHKLFMLIENHSLADKHVRDKTFTKDMITILKLLRDGKEITYYCNANKDDPEKKTVHKFQAVVRSAMDAIIDNVGSDKTLAVLAANWKSSLFGQLANHRPDVTVKESSTVRGMSLEVKYKQRCRIKPILKDGHWSLALKDKRVCDGLAYQTDEELIRVFAQRFIMDQFKDGFLLCKNEDDDKHLLPHLVALSNLDDKDPRKVDIKSSELHGLNNLSHHTKVAIMFALNPSGDQVQTLNIANDEMGLPKGTLRNAVLTERFKEAVHQCIARCGIRLSFDPTKEDIEYQFIVPDMRSAEYLAEWFEDGRAIIDTSLSYSTKRTESVDATAARNAQIREEKELKKMEKQTKARNLRLATVQAILTDMKANVAPVKDLLLKYGITRPTYDRYRKEFKTQLQELGLL